MKISLDYGTERLTGRSPELYPKCGMLFDMNSTRTNKVEVLDSAEADPKAIEAIRRALEAHYSRLIQAPLPDKFVELLAQLEREEGSRTQGSPDAVG
jgi:hypothetical protein